MALLQEGRQIPGHFVARPATVRTGRMSLSFEELDFRPTPMGVLSLRRRRRPMSDVDVYEIKLGDEFLMSSQFTAAEIELARLGLAALGRGGSRRGGWRPRARLHRARGARKCRRAIADRGRCACRGHRMARAGIASARQGADGRSALPPRPWRLLRDVVLRRRLRSSFAGPPFRCGAGGYRSLAAQVAASAPRRAVRAGRAGPACRPSPSRRRFRAVVERSAG